MPKETHSFQQKRKCIKKQISSLAFMTFLLKIAINKVSSFRNLIKEERKSKNYKLAVCIIECNSMIGLRLNPLIRIILRIELIGEESQ